MTVKHHTREYRSTTLDWEGGMGHTAAEEIPRRH